MPNPPNFTGEDHGAIDSIELIFRYALLSNGYNAFGGLEDLAETTNKRTEEFALSGTWTGTARELRGCLFFLQRQWRWWGELPRGDDLRAIRSLFQAIQNRVRMGDLAPNDPVDGFGDSETPQVALKGQIGRLLQSNSGPSMSVVAFDSSGEVVETQSDLVIRFAEI